MADDEPHSEVEDAISEHMLLDDVALLHSTSWQSTARVWCSPIWQ